MPHHLVTKKPTLTSVISEKWSPSNRHRSTALKEDLGSCKRKI